MKKIKLSLILLSAIFMFAGGMFLTSCDKTELVAPNENEGLENEKIDIDVIKKNAIAFSQTHDAIILKMLDLEEAKLKVKIKETNNKAEVLNEEDLLDIIEETIGVRPIIITDDMLSQINSPVFNLDVDEIKLSDYATSEIAQKHFTLIDEIMQDENLTILEKIQNINEVQEKIVNDKEATVSDIKNVLTSTETLKGSLILWNKEFGNVSKTKWPPALWPTWKKLAFIAAADALGGVIGYFAGGIIRVNGQSMYVPPTAPGTVAMAVLLSYIAVHFVGW